MAWATPPYHFVTNDLLSQARLQTWEDAINASAAAVVSTAGDTVYATGPNAFARLAIGGLNYVNISDGTKPIWSSSLSLTSLAVSGNATVGGNAIVGDTLTVSKTIDSQFIGAYLRNLSAGTLAYTSLEIGNNASALRGEISVFGSGYTPPATDALADSMRILSNGAGGLSYRTSHPSGTHRFYVGTAQAFVINADASITAAGGFYIGAGGLTVAGGPVTFPAATVSPAAMNSPQVFFHETGLTNATTGYQDIVSGGAEVVDTNNICGSRVVTFNAATAGRYVVIGGAKMLSSTGGGMAIRIAKNGADMGGTSKEMSISGILTWELEAVTFGIGTFVNGDTLSLQGMAVNGGADDFLNGSLICIRIG